jgi:hypothetical protein
MVYEWMILPNLNLHPLYYFWFIETFFTEDEFEKVMSIPLIEKQGVNALPIVLEPISIKTNGFSYAA